MGSLKDLGEVSPLTPLLLLTGIIILTKSLVLYPQVMADHPFFFVIRDRRTGVCHVTNTYSVFQDFFNLFFFFFVAGSILFMGRVTTPEIIDPSGRDFDAL